MKTVKDWKKEVDKVLAEKVSGAIEDFQTARDQELSELAELSATLESREAEKKTMTNELESLNMLTDQRRHRELSLKLRRLDRDVVSFRERRDTLFLKLTKLPDVFRDTYLFLKLIQG